jgi:tRNA pseudouridine38-40 synthase
MPYSGWQKQKNAHSVQAELEQKLSIILAEPSSVKGAGRTDAGVHARQQFVHFDTEATIPPHFLYRLNCLLPAHIVARALYEPIPQTLDARWDALWRVYKYYIVKKKNPFYQRLVLPFFRKLDIERMNRASLYLLGEKDFASFCKAHGQQKTTVCDIRYAKWKEKGDFIIFTIQANRFLRGMVRAIVGTLLGIGLEKQSIEEFRALLEAKDRTLAGENVEPYGLYLHRIFYPPQSLKPIMSI